MTITNLELSRIAELEVRVAALEAQTRWDGGPQETIDRAKRILKEDKHDPVITMALVVHIAEMLTSERDAQD